jgi:acetylornithine deacetylase/succinyl-diaminopimelate desuccinylase-like protein
MVMRTGSSPFPAEIDPAPVLAFAQSDTARLLEEWQRIAVIAAPAGHEGERAALVAELARAAGADTVEIDRVGNVVATVGGRDPAGETITFLATMDDLESVAFERSRTDAIGVVGDRVVGPCAETTSSDATALALIRFAVSGQRSWRQLTVAFVVGEETGLTGVRALCADRGGELGLVVDLMGGTGTVSYNAIGFDGVVVEFSAAPRHSLYGGVSEVSEAISRLVAEIHQDVPVLDKNVHTVRRVNQLAAGTVFNHSPSTGTVGIDIRSTDPVVLAALSESTRTQARHIASDLGIEVEIRPGQQQTAISLPGAAEHRLVRAAARAVEQIGHELVLRPYSSSNVNAVLEAGIEGIVLDGMHRGGGRGTADEWADIPCVVAGLAVDCQLLRILSEG